MIILTGCKNIYQKQLPKMPREYIARLVYDRWVQVYGVHCNTRRNHASMAIVKKGLRVVGGITYRVFPGRQFAEIVFCAITSTEQVKVPLTLDICITVWISGIRLAIDEPLERLHSATYGRGPLSYLRRQLCHRILQETGNNSTVITFVTW